MIAYWIKAGLLVVGFVAASWITAGYGVAYWRTRLGRYVARALAYLFNAGVMLFFGQQLIDSGGRHPSYFPLVLVLCLSLFQLANLWWQLEPQPQYRHAREIILFWRTPARQGDPDPARGLHVPVASPAPLSAQTQRRISMIVTLVAVVAILATFVISVLR